ncbi:hypothetical protein AMTRI_Chr03g142240 [Amborella trichopoda]
MAVCTIVPYLPAHNLTSRGVHHFTYRRAHLLTYRRVHILSIAVCAPLLHRRLPLSIPSPCAPLYTTAKLSPIFIAYPFSLSTANLSFLFLSFLFNSSNPFQSNTVYSFPFSSIAQTLFNQTHAAIAAVSSSSGHNPCSTFHSSCFNASSTIATCFLSLPPFFFSISSTLLLQPLQPLLLPTTCCSRSLSPPILSNLRPASAAAPFSSLLQPTQPRLLCSSLHPPEPGRSIAAIFASTSLYSSNLTSLPSLAGSLHLSPPPATSHFLPLKPISPHLLLFVPFVSFYSLRSIPFRLTFHPSSNPLIERSPPNHSKPNIQLLSPLSKTTNPIPNSLSLN